METQQDAVLNVDNPGTKLTNRNNHSEIDPKQTALLTTATALVTNLNTWYHTVFVYNLFKSSLLLQLLLET